MAEIFDLLADGTITDPFFDVLHDGQWNACIGRQGEELNYVEGYLQAAQLLVDSLIEKKLYGSRDTIAMPILQNARHGLELALKYLLRELSSIGMAQDREGAVDHDVKAYYDHLTGQKVGDAETRELLAALAPFAESLGKIDPDGQELRYFENRDGKQSLAGYAVVNLPLIQASITGLREILDRLVRRAFALEVEVAAGTNTPECSRKDLVAIAGIVGAKVAWTEEGFLDRKAEAMTRFGLFNNAISRALSAIKTSRELRTLIGMEAPLLHLSAKTVTDIVGRWLDVNPPPAIDAEPTVLTAADFDFDDMRHHSQRTAALDRDVFDRLSLEEFADLQTIYYIGRNRQFGEHYERALEGTLAEHRVDPRRIVRVHDILSKTNFIEGLAEGLKRIGQPGLAGQVLDLQTQTRPKS